MSLLVLAWSFLMERLRTLRVVLAAGEPTTVVVVAVVIAVLVRPVVTVVPLRSTQDAWTSMVPDAEVTT